MPGQLLDRRDLGAGVIRDGRHGEDGRGAMPSKGAKRRLASWFQAVAQVTS
ncbi:hypothetical protein SAMN05443665_101878 [Actinomadura meyerae]|jgi:hypothetical protein|uniref:Uncharacterized protein n=1 Tax=Actinomadura meyerae TaxID=240840 RepID=A0A239KJM2_9ACTN|nr:hypothetical protein SAMN05443665_101878 [Actinomadura meyerae]